MAEKEIENDDSQEQEEKKRKKPSVSLFQIIIIVLLLAVLGLGGFIAWKLINLEIPAAASDQQQLEEPAVAGPGILIDMDNITINLADEEESRFLRVKMKLEVKDEESRTKVNTYNAQIKDLIITTLSSKTFDDVRTPQGKYNLKEELIYRINSFVGEEPVKNMFFSDFVAQ